MNNGKAIPVWFNEDDRRRVEEAAALAGYRHLSKYIRDKALERGRYRAMDGNGIDAWADRQELAGRLAGIEQSQRQLHTLSTMLLFLMRKKMTTGEINDLVVACGHALEPEDILAGVAPDLIALVAQLVEPA